MDELAAFITARYDEAEAVAMAAATTEDGAAWVTSESDDSDKRAIRTPAPDWRWVGELYTETAEHVAATDPAHRLRDITLKRAILAEYVSFREESAKGDVGPGLHMGTQVLGDAVRQLGTEFSDHPGYRAEWSPEGA